MNFQSILTMLQGGSDPMALFNLLDPNMANEFKSLQSHGPQGLQQYVKGMFSKNPNMLDQFSKYTGIDASQVRTLLGM